MAIEHESDEALASRAGWDSEAMTELYRRYRPPIEGYCRGCIRDPDRAMDVVSTIFHKVFEALRKPGQQIENFGAWIRRIAKNEAINSFRKYERETPMGETFDQADHNPGPEDIVFGNITRQMFREAMVAVLTPDEYKVVDLRLLGMTNPEIEEEMGRTYSWVGSTFHRACKKLKKYVDDLKQKGEYP